VKTVLKYALAVAALSIILKLIIFLSGLQHQWADNYYVYFVFLIVLAGIFLGMREEKVNAKGLLPIRDLIKAGCQIAGINALLMGAFLYLFYSVIDPEYFKIKMDTTIQLMMQNGTTVEQVRDYIINASLIFTTKNVASFALFGYLAMGCFYAVLAGFTLRSKKF
jgi:hypothetical protein